MHLQHYCCVSHSTSLTLSVPEPQPGPSLTIPDLDVEDVPDKESHVVYTENEADNSCVVNVGEEDSDSSDDGDDTANALSYMLKYGHDIDKSGTV